MLFIYFSLPNLPSWSSFSSESDNRVNSLLRSFMACFSFSNIHKVFHYSHAHDSYSNLLCQFIAFPDTGPPLPPHTKHYVIIKLFLSSLEKSVCVTTATCKYAISQENKLIMRLTRKETFFFEGGNRVG